MAGVALAPAIEDDLLEIELQQLIEEEAKKQQLMDLLCPYCGWMYSPHQGCFCFRLVSWDELT
ncbi:MAG TPA: hypothetical protein VD837_07925 [Terriglobales bacterium]|nr:hypothetical protein [Terriglobales bacterium]